jgi:hypothetical protein
MGRILEISELDLRNISNWWNFDDDAVRNMSFYGLLIFV